MIVAQLFVVVTKNAKFFLGIFWPMPGLKRMGVGAMVGFLMGRVVCRRGLEK